MCILNSQYFISFYYISVYVYFCYAHFEVSLLLFSLFLKLLLLLLICWLLHIMLLLINTTCQLKIWNLTSDVAFQSTSLQSPHSHHSGETVQCQAVRKVPHCILGHIGLSFLVKHVSHLSALLPRRF